MKIYFLFNLVIININILHNQQPFAAKLHNFLPEIDDLDIGFYKLNDEPQLNDDEKIIKRTNGDSENFSNDSEIPNDVDRDEIVKKIVQELRNYVKKITEGLNSIENNITSDENAGEGPEVVEELTTQHQNTTTAPKHDSQFDKHKEPKNHTNIAPPQHTTEPRIHKIHDDKTDETTTTEAPSDDQECMESTKKDVTTSTASTASRSINNSDKSSKDNEQQIEYDIVDPENKIEEIKPSYQEVFKDKPTQRKTGVFDPFFNQILYPSEEGENLHDSDLQHFTKLKNENIDANAERKNKKRDNEKWTDWSEWTGCSVTCGYGKQLRYRKCANNDCEADIEMDEKNCAQPNCHPDLMNVLSFF